MNITESKEVRSDHAEKGTGVDFTTLNDAGLHDKVLNEEARQATASEHSLSLIQALKTYKKAALWSIRKSNLEYPEKVPQPLESEQELTKTWSDKSFLPPSLWKVTIPRSSAPSWATLRFETSTGRTKTL